MPQIANEISIGTGVLTWSGCERVSDRYGFVFLMHDGETSLTKGKVYPVPLSSEPKDGEYGVLVARIVETRKSTHVGDLFRRVFPRETESGKRLVLGHGQLVRRHDSGFTHIGICPRGADKEESVTTWMDVRALYDCHEHLVELIFIPGELSVVE
jgi:hypothetical protein